MLDNIILKNYKQVLNDLQNLKDNLNNKSNNCIKEELLYIIERGWEQIDTMYDIKQLDEKKDLQVEQEKIQRHFNEMLRLMPITRMNVSNNDNT